MARKKSIEKGPALEARIQRLFMCQGAFAERGLLLRPARAATNLVSDVDVVAHDYSINFYHTRIYAECKGGEVRLASGSLGLEQTRKVMRSALELAKAKLREHGLGTSAKLGR